MSELQKKIARIQRLRFLEENRMKSLAAELSAIQQQLDELQGQLETLHQEQEAALVSPESASITRHRQSLIWSQCLQTRVTEVQQQIAETQQERDSMLERVVQQKTKVRGWETLQENLSEQEASELATAQSLDADDRHLQSRLER